MLTNMDKGVLEELRAYLTSLEGSEPPRSDFDKKLSLYQDLLNHMEKGLQVATESFRPLTEEDSALGFYQAECTKCGWYGVSKNLEGCCPIADTGEFSDPLCPVCLSTRVQEKRS